MENDDLIETGDKNICEGGLILKAMCSSQFVGKCYNKLPILTNIKDQRRRRVFRKLGSGGYFKVPVVLGSKTFQKYFAIDHKGMSSSGGDNAEGNSVDDVAVLGDKGMSKRISLKPRRWMSPRMDEVSNISLEKAKSKGKEAMSLPPPMAKKAKPSVTSSAPATKGAKSVISPREDTLANHGPTLGPGASMLGNPSVAEKILSGVILLADKKNVDKLSLNQGVTKVFHIVGQQEVVLGSSFTVRSRDIGNEATFQIARAESAEIKMVQAQSWTIELEGLLVEFSEQEKKAAEELKAKIDVVASEGFDFCKRQLAHHHPKLSMGLDHDLLEEEPEEEAEDKGEDKEKEENKEKGDTSPFSH
ncbi:Ribose-phosphate pyrophosphokinase [Actinidia chinensis var. chinensis]|uniref:Ribose-phosphate pyrophosphokinase n=1 Tax=Actinidia chinensis var. chinensis TaxID=1590841 RepID=A0A2R6QHF5_ACTCC|nr:Ribose-phosphate pyrophosphokinase [Actinidia chinensis var. chinensis]